MPRNARIRRDAKPQAAGHALRHAAAAAADEAMPLRALVAEQVRHDLEEHAEVVGDRVVGEPRLSRRSVPMRVTRNE